jgi:carbonic anhydrase/acetyltransferase-like protein (isoleucine patch superfamily)
MTLVAAWVHPTALVEQGVVLGEGTKIWDNVHLRRGARIGKSCIIGEKSYVAYDVVIGDYVKLNAAVYVCAAVTIEDFCMISAHTVFTNDRFPRAGNRELTGLETSVRASRSASSRWSAWVRWSRRTSPRTRSWSETRRVKSGGCAAAAIPSPGSPKSRRSPMRASGAASAESRT